MKRSPFVRSSHLVPPRPGRTGWLFVHSSVRNTGTNGRGTNHPRPTPPHSSPTQTGATMSTRVILPHDRDFLADWHRAVPTQATRRRRGPSDTSLPPHVWRRERSRSGTQAAGTRKSPSPRARPVTWGNAGRDSQTARRERGARETDEGATRKSPGPRGPRALEELEVFQTSEDRVEPSTVSLPTAKLGRHTVVGQPIHESRRIPPLDLLYGT